MPGRHKRQKVDLYGLLAGDEDAEPRGCAEALLTSTDDDVDAPAVHLDVLARDGTHGIKHDERFGGDPIHSLGHELRVRKYA